MPGKDNLANKNLPREKQYLVTTGVPCEKRIKDLQRLYEDNDNLERDAEDGWVETTNPEKKEKEEECMDIDNLDGEDQKMQVVNNKEEAKDDDGSDGFDLDAMSDDDENMFATPANNNKEEEKKNNDQIAQANNSNIIRKARKYDLSITYDFFTQTPRLWLTGFNEDGQPLS